MVEMLGMQSEGRAYHDQQLYDLGWGVAYIGAIVLLAPLNPLTRNWNTDIRISRPRLHISN